VVEQVDEIYTDDAGKWDDRYGVLFLLIVTCMLMTAANTTWLKIAAVVILGGTVLFAFLAARAGRRAWRFATLAIPVAVVIGMVGELDDGRGARLTAAVVSIILPIVAIGALGRRLVKEHDVSGRTVLRLLSVYLLIGMTFAALYATIGIASDEPFFAQTKDAQPVDFAYFSYITIATVGYGDLTPANPLPRMLAAIEGLTGQLYLVTVVAVAVSRVRTRRDRAREDEG
jgi:Ion channel